MRCTRGLWRRAPRRLFGVVLVGASLTGLGLPSNAGAAVGTDATRTRATGGETGPTVTAPSTTATTAPPDGRSETSRSGAPAAASEPTVPGDEPAGAPGTMRAGDPGPDQVAGAPSDAGSAALEPAATTWLSGVDVSNFQHPNGAAINWSAVAGSGRRFAYVKATEGPIGASCTGRPYTNPWFRSDYDGAGAAGLWRGAYHYAHPRLPLSTAATDAQAFVAAAGVPGTARELPPVLDLEETCGMAPATIVAWARAWLDQVQSLTGMRPIVYTGWSYWQSSVGGDATLAAAGFPLFMARYQSSTAGPLPGRWPDWTLWQWSGSGSVPGIAAGVDLDWFQGDENALAALVNRSRGDTPSMAIERNTDGRAEVAWVDAGGSLWQRWESGGRWSGGWNRGSGVVRATLVRNADGRLEVFAITGYGSLIHSWQACPGCSWSGWYLMGTGFGTTTIAAARNADGRLEVVGRSADGTLVHSWQACPGCGWAGIWPFGPRSASPVALAANADGRLEAVTASGPTLVHAWQTRPDGPWSSWFGLAEGVDPAATPAAARGKDGRLVAAWRDPSGRLRSIGQLVPDGPWAGAVTVPVGNVAIGASLSADGASMWVSSCGASSTAAAVIDPRTGSWLAAAPAPVSGCRSTLVMGDRAGPPILIWGNSLGVASPGRSATVL